MTTKTNQDIVLDILKGDNRAIKEFYKNNLPTVTQHILQNSGNKEDAYDIFQDALVVIFKKARENSLEITGSMQSYFYGVCKKLWLNKLRKNKKLILNEKLLQNHKEENTIIEDIGAIEKDILYKKYFHKLHPDSQKVLHLYFEGSSMKEIAYIMGYSELYARKKKFKIKKRLLKMIEKDPLYLEFISSNKLRPNIELHMIPK